MPYKLSYMYNSNFFTYNILSLSHLRPNTSPPLPLLVLLVSSPAVTTTAADSSIVMVYTLSLRVSRPCTTCPPSLTWCPWSCQLTRCRWQYPQYTSSHSRSAPHFLSLQVNTTLPLSLLVLVQVLPALRAQSPCHRYM